MSRSITYARTRDHRARVALVHALGCLSARAFDDREEPVVTPSPFAHAPERTRSGASVERCRCHGLLGGAEPEGCRCEDCQDPFLR